MNKIEKPTPAPLPAADSNEGREDDQLKEACQEFESIFLQQMISEMRKPQFDDGMFKESQDDEMYQDMMNQQIAKQVAGQDQLGLANLLYDQLKGRP